MISSCAWLDLQGFSIIKAVWAAAPFGGSEFSSGSKLSKVSLEEGHDLNEAVFWDLGRVSQLDLFYKLPLYRSPLHY